MNSVRKRLEIAENFYPHVNDLEKLIKKLYKIPRSILGDGFRKSLKLLQEELEVPFVWHDVKSGTQVLDWIVPKEWVIKEAYILNPRGKKIADFNKHNLHVVNYSCAVNKTVSLQELKKHLYTVPKLPDEIPYVTSYYNETWGFCISQNEYDNLIEGEYKVFIDSKHIEGSLVYGELVLPGETKKEILLTSYLCHPQMANHELGGPIALCHLYKLLKNTGPHKYTYRFLICPENIGSAAFLQNTGEIVDKVIEAGFILNCLGFGEEWTLKKSRLGNSFSDLLAKNTLASSKLPLTICDFFPDGSDERQFCSPGYNWPISLVMRKMYGTFQQYHTSADNLDFINYKTLFESIKMHFKIMMAAELNFVPFARVQKGTPMLSRSPANLYPKIMNFLDQSKQESTRVILAILNMSDGNSNLIEIAEHYSFSLIEHAEVIEKLCQNNYILEYKT